MKWPFNLIKNTKGINQELVEQYKELRATGRGLNLTLIKQLPKAAVPECGKKLGIFKAGTLILNNDDEITILYDYCLYHYRRGGKNVIERYLDNTPPSPDSAEAIVLKAMLASNYSVFKVLDILPNQGASLQDRLTNQIINLVDISLSGTGYVGLDLAGRLLPFNSFHMSSGSLIPLPNRLYEEKLYPIIKKFSKANEEGSKPSLSVGQEAAFVAELIRVSLHEGGADNVFYTDIEH